MFRRFWWVFPACLIGCPLLGLLVGGVIAYVSPKNYESSATIQVRQTDGAVMAQLGQLTHPSPSTFIATELEVIRAQTTLDIAIDQLDLTSAWGMDRAQVTEQLRQAITASSIQGTDLIEITVRTTSPDEARAIAGAVSDAYRTRRRELELMRTDAAMAKLREAVRSQEHIVEDRRKVLVQVIRSTAADSQSENHEEAVNNGAYTLDEAKSEYEAAQSLLEELKVKLVSEEVQAKLTGDSVIVHANPVEPMAPTAPNVMLLLSFGAAGGLLLGILVPFLLIPLFHAMAKPKAT